MTCENCEANAQAREAAERDRDFFANRLNEALGALGYEVPGDTPEGRYKCGLCGPKSAALLDADHDWALWAEKWKAALDLMGNQSERATKAEKERDEARARPDRRALIALQDMTWDEHGVPTSWPTREYVESIMGGRDDAVKKQDLRIARGVFALEARAEAAEARIREVEQEVEGLTVSRDHYRVSYTNLLEKNAGHPTMCCGQCASTLRELRAALEEEGHFRVEFGPVGLGVIENCARCRKPWPCPTSALLARTETPKAIVEPAENASNRKE